MSPWKLAVLSFFLLLSGIHQSFADRPMPLGSGKTVQMISVDTVKSTAGEPFLHLSYRTSLAMTDKTGLREEADDVWNSFEAFAEKSQYGHAVIQAVGPEVPGKPAPSHATMFDGSNETWHVRDFKPGETPKVTKEKAKAVLAYLDSAYGNKELPSLALYLAGDWTVALSGKNVPPQTQDRAQAIAMAQTVFDRMPVFNHTRQIQSATMADDGQSVTVTSIETTTGTLNGQLIKIEEHSEDQVGIEGNSLVILKSKSDGGILKN